MNLLTDSIVHDFIYRIGIHKTLCDVLFSSSVSFYKLELLIEIITALRSRLRFRPKRRIKIIQNFTNPATLSYWSPWTQKTKKYTLSFQNRSINLHTYNHFFGKRYIFPAKSAKIVYFTRKIHILLSLSQLGLYLLI